MRLAALDLGSNSFHALVADVRRGGRLEAVDRGKRMPRIGEGIFRTGEISAAARKEALRALADLMPVIERNRPDAVYAIATSAIREARNGSAFVAEVKARFGLQVRVISGDEEARLSYAGARARLGSDLGRATMFDLGGGSLEVVVGDGDRIVRTASAPLGVLRAVVERPLSAPATASELRALEQWARRTVASFLQPVDGIDAGEVVLCAGTARAVRSVARAMQIIPAQGPGSDRVSRYTLRHIVERLAPVPLAARRQTPGLDPGRADLIIHGAVLLDALMAGVGVDDALVCRAALREGLILHHASRKLATGTRGRARTPAPRAGAARRAYAASAP